MRLRILEQLTVLFFDIIAIFFAFISAYLLRLGSFSRSDFPFEPYIKMAILTIPIWIIFLIIAGRYALQDSTLKEHLQKSSLSSLAASLLFPLLFFFQNETFFSRGIILLLFVLSVIYLFGVRFLVQYFVKKEIKKDKNIIRLLVIGANRSSEKVIETLIKNTSRRKPIAVLAPYGSKKKNICGVEILGKLDALEKVVEEKQIDSIFVCEGSEHSANIHSFCQNKGIFFLTSLESFGISSHLQDHREERVGNIPSLGIFPSPLFGWGQFFKRGFDVCVSMAVLFFLFPYFLWNFKYLKRKPFKKNFRENFDGFVFEKNGKIFGKKISLMVNVLLKDLSIIGPCVFTPQEFSDYFGDKISTRAMHRFLLRPGILGVSNGKYNNPEDLLIDERIYILQWQFTTDLKILWRNILKPQ